MEDLKIDLATTPLGMAKIVQQVDLCVGGKKTHTDSLNQVLHADLIIGNNLTKLSIIHINLILGTIILHVCITPVEFVHCLLADVLRLNPSSTNTLLRPLKMMRFISSLGRGNLRIKIGNTSLM